METLENLFSSDNEIVDKLKENVVKIDFNKIFFEHLGPELRKLFYEKKDKVYIKNFLEASQYEYGFFGKAIDLQKALSLYKKYADLTDYFCMYKMHVIYLSEYEKFNVPFSRVGEKLYLLKCLAYLPNYVYDWRLKLFEKIDILYEIAGCLDLEDNSLEKHKLFFDLLNYQREQYNLSENDINLMKGVFSCYFYKEDEKEANEISFCMLNSLIPNGELDYAYYHSKNKSIYFQTYLKLETQMISESDIENFYKEVKDKKLYEFYSDYGNYLLDKKNNSDPEIIEIFSSAAKEGDLFGSFRVYQSLIDYYDFDAIMEDYDKACTILDYLLDEIVFERLLLGQFVLLMGFLIKYSKFADKIISKYLIYVKEIDDYITFIRNRREKEEKKANEEEDYIYGIKSYIYYFGFQGIEKQNYEKALKSIEKGISITEAMYNKKRNKFFRYILLKVMNSHKLISDEDLAKEKKELIEFYSKNLSLKYQTIDCYLMGEDYFEGNINKQDKANTFLIYDYAQKIFCKTILDWKIRKEIKLFLKNHENKFEKKLKDETCCICYEKKVNKTFIPCKHNFCSVCIEKLEKDARCPMCRSEILCII